MVQLLGEADVRWDETVEGFIRGNACVREDARLLRRLGEPSDWGAARPPSEDTEKEALRDVWQGHCGVLKTGFPLRHPVPPRSGPASFSLPCPGTGCRKHGLHADGIESGVSDQGSWLIEPLSGFPRCILMAARDKTSNSIGCVCSRSHCAPLKYVLSSQVGT